MKVGILGTRGIPNNYGGFEQFTQFLAPELVKRGHEVFVYNSSLHPYQEKTWQGVHLISCKDPESSIGTAGQFLYDKYCNRDAQKRGFDMLFHLGYSSDSIGWRGWPKKTVNIINMDGLEWKRTKYKWITRRFLKRAEALAAKHGDVLIADSLAMQDYLFHAYKKKSVFIPYAASILENADPDQLLPFAVKPNEYFLLIARMEPENNIEMIINGFILSESKLPLLIIGNTENKNGNKWKKKYESERIRFIGGLYDENKLNSLRHFSSIYFHGHSVGGTNPSLLEAMACGANMAAHDNVFNKAILQNDASWFSNADDVAEIIKSSLSSLISEGRKKRNLEKIRTDFAPKIIVDAYENLILDNVRS
jgi:glycosyltransferase involved in cell wall biosynthesis